MSCEPLFRCPPHRLNNIADDGLRSSRRAIASAIVRSHELCTGMIQDHEDVVVAVSRIKPVVDNREPASDRTIVSTSILPSRIPVEIVCVLLPTSRLCPRRDDI